MVKDVNKTKNSSLKAAIHKKRIMIQQTQRNSEFNSRSKKQLNVKRDAAPVKLPTIVKKTPSLTPKSIPPAYIHNSSQSQVAPVTVIKPPPRPKSLKPIFIPPQIPSIKEHVTRANLTQKATLRCKSPRAGSACSHSTTFVATDSQEQFQTQHPLQRMDVGSLLSESARKRLTRLFNKLDTDKDGHLSYPQVQRCLPSSLPHAQMTFFRVLYDIISGATFFGLQEFYATAIILEMVAEQDSTLWNTYLDDVDFNYYLNSIQELLDGFNNRCSSDRGTITYKTLIELIMSQTRNGHIERISNELEYIMPKNKKTKINRIEFIALLPAIIYIESCLEQGRSLFRFRENSLLDTHMRQAVLT